MAVKGIGVGGVAMMGGGLLFIWSAFHGASLSGSLRDLLQGKQPSGSDVNSITGSGSTAGFTGGGSTSGGGPALGHYSHSQLEQLWTSNGGNPSAANIAAAIAQAESSGDPNASNVNSNGSIDRGLWQINSVHGSLSTFDVTGNVHAAIMISGNGSNWSPWVTFNTGAYRQFLA